MMFLRLPRERKLRICGIFAIALAASLYGCADHSEKEQRPKNTPTGFNLHPDFEMKLVAAEPLIQDPVDMEVDELNNMYVVEMRGNPYDSRGAGTVKLLKDTNDDGRMDKSFLFADSLRMPSGVMRWKKGILVTDPPHILYFEDTNGDNIADRRQVILSGFDSTDLESNVNNPYYGLDNWIYVGNGGRSGAGIHYPDHPNSGRLANNANGQRVRFRPEQRSLEAQSARTQFGHTEDAAGHALLVAHNVHIYEEVIAAKYLNRNPALLISSATEKIADHSSQVFPRTVNPEHQLLTDKGVFTAACGITSYQGGAFGKEYANAVFVAEPAHNLVHIDILKPHGATHTASRTDSSREFLTSTDPWFRPVNIYVGPDGALYVVDYYRQFIEGPAFMSEEILKTANLYNGTDKGRIYKITKRNVVAQQNKNAFDFSDAHLAERISDPNIWWRRTAQRLIIDRNATTLVPQLEKIISDGKSAEGSVHALWTLSGLNKISANTLIIALNDAHHSVRENAIRISEQVSNSPAIKSKLLGMVNDTDARVRFQLACTIGEYQTPDASAALEQMLFKYPDDLWMQVAVLTSTNLNTEKLLTDAINKSLRANNSFTLLVERLSSIVTASGSAQQFSRLLESSLREETGVFSWQPAVLRGIAATIQQRKSSASQFGGISPKLLKSVVYSKNEDIRKEAMSILKIIGVDDRSPNDALVVQAAAIAMDTNVSVARRVASIEVLAQAAPKTYEAHFRKLLNNKEPLAVQLAAINGYSAVAGPAFSDFIVKEWKSFTPGLKDEAVNTLLMNRQRVAVLLKALEEKHIPASLLGWPRSVRLMAGRWPKPNGTTAEDSTLIKKARNLLAASQTSRKNVVKEYYAAITTDSDKQKGKRVFMQNCGLCHQVNGAQGVKLGPDLNTVRNWDAAELITKIIEPNQSVKGGYELWDIQLTNGKYIQGIITSETTNAITVANTNTPPAAIARKDIKSISSSGMTIMPSGFEKQISKEEMAALIAYLKNE